MHHDSSFDQMIIRTNFRNNMAFRVYIVARTLQIVSHTNTRVALSTYLPA
jgi:hypothetical protein